MATPDTPLRSEAQQRADEIAIFRAELARLEAEGVLRPGRNATVRPQLLTVDNRRRVGGYIGGLGLRQINVPFEQRLALEPVLRNPNRTPKAPGIPFEATIAFGQRLEPWLESVRVGR